MFLCDASLRLEINTKCNDVNGSDNIVTLKKFKTYCYLLTRVTITALLSRL